MNRKSDSVIFICLFLVTLSTLLVELLLTRIFSATMWHHFAFLSVSVAMFGMTIGAMIVQYIKNYFSSENAKERMMNYSILFAVSIPLSFIAHLTIRVDFALNFMALFSTFFFFIVIAIPFIISGIIVSLALTRYKASVSKLYFWDLAGAALACIIIIPLLNSLDAPSLMILTGIFPLIGSLLIAVNKASETKESALKKPVAVIVIILLLLVFAFYNHSHRLVAISWFKGKLERNLEYEKWNSYSRISVFPSGPKPFGWGINRKMIQGLKAEQKRLYIDSSSLTVLTKFNGNFNSVAYLALDISNLGHYLKAGGDIAIIGAGGGRDILSALLFGYKNIYAIEINSAIINLLENKYAEYTGNLKKYPQVKLINDEARSWIMRSDKKFDLIQVSFIDTWAATSAGAFALTENSLYTVNAWKKFLNKLNTGGVLSFTRWSVGDYSPESMRLVILAIETLKQSGISDPQKHILFARSYTDVRNSSNPCGTILVSNAPFTKEQIETIRNTANQNGFGLIVEPEKVSLPSYQQLFTGDYKAYLEKSPLNLAAPTDDKPYFFNFLKIKDALFSSGLKSIDINTKAKQAAIYILGNLLIVVLVISIFFIILPLLYTRGRKSSASVRAIPTTLFFASIGFAFMLIEISQLSRLTTYLGHPIYGLAVALFLMLLSSSLGAYWSDSFMQDRKARSKKMNMIFGVLILILALYALLTPIIIDKTDALQTHFRILISGLMIIPMGFLMGVPFPFGMTIAKERKDSPTALYWGINGAASVTSSVLAVAISIQFGITAAFLIGAFFYIAAYICYLFMKK
jgi:predicted membrane-bound spermidine synthase